MKEHLERLHRHLTDEFGNKPWTCSLATSDADGNPTVRTMVVREISATGGLLFASDRRTSKDAHLHERPICEVCFWLPTQNVQARVRGEAVIVDAMDDEAMRQQWWSRVDRRVVQMFTGIAGNADDTPMPVTFELITITPSRIEIGDYKQSPPAVTKWEG